MNSRPTDIELLSRAILAYFRRFGPLADRPSIASWVDGDHVRLVNCNGPLASFKIGPTGRLNYQQD
jgi:hypothetical protein